MSGWIYIHNLPTSSTAWHVTWQLMATVARFSFGDDQLYTLCDFSVSCNESHLNGFRGSVYFNTNSRVVYRFEEP